MAVRDELERVDARELFPVERNKAPSEVANRRREGTRLGGGVRSGGRGEGPKGHATTLGRGIKFRAGGGRGWRAVRCGPTRPIIFSVEGR